MFSAINFHFHPDRCLVPDFALCLALNFYSQIEKFVRSPNCDLERTGCMLFLPLYRPEVAWQDTSAEQRPKTFTVFKATKIYLTRKKKLKDGR